MTALVMLGVLCSGAAFTQTTTPGAPPETKQYDSWIAEWCSGESYAPDRKASHGDAENIVKRKPDGNVLHDADHSLDFWLGSWKVYVRGKYAGTDRVESIVRGYGVIENWKDANGSTGKSLFYFVPAEKKWRQVWVTETGVYKEKSSSPMPQGIRFSGHVFLPNGRSVEDRTTLTRLSDGDVHQIIEQKRPGKDWVVGFDAIYKRSTTPVKE